MCFLWDKLDDKNGAIMSELPDFSKYVFASAVPSDFHAFAIEEEELSDVVDHVSRLQNDELKAWSSQRRPDLNPSKYNSVLELARLKESEIQKIKTFASVVKGVHSRWNKNPDVKSLNAILKESFRHIDYWGKLANSKAKFFQQFAESWASSFTRINYHFPPIRVSAEHQKTSLLVPDIELKKEAFQGARADDTGVNVLIYRPTGPNPVLESRFKTDSLVLKIAMAIMDMVNKDIPDTYYASDFAISDLFGVSLSFFRGFSDKDRQRKGLTFPEIEALKSKDEKKLELEKYVLDLEKDSDLFVNDILTRSHKFRDKNPHVYFREGKDVIMRHFLSYVNRNLDKGPFNDAYVEFRFLYDDQVRNERVGSASHSAYKNKLISKYMADPFFVEMLGMLDEIIDEHHYFRLGNIPEGKDSALKWLKAKERSFYDLSKLSEKDIIFFSGGRMVSAKRKVVSGERDGYIRRERYPDLDLVQTQIIDDILIGYASLLKKDLSGDISVSPRVWDSACMWRGFARFHEFPRNVYGSSDQNSLTRLDFVLEKGFR
jgi:hypothetical protein